MSHLPSLRDSGSISLHPALKALGYDIPPFRGINSSGYTVAACDEIKPTLLNLLIDIGLRDRVGRGWALSHVRGFHVLAPEC